MELTVKNLTTEAERDLAQSFGAVKSALPGDARIARLRSDAFADYAARGLPHRRVEEWKYTDLRARMKEALRPGEAAPGEVADLRRLLGAEASFVPICPIWTSCALRASRRLASPRRWPRRPPGSPNISRR
jgi:hypothetical protein